eukprot:5349880-Prymnesium_polylepis.1
MIRAGPSRCFERLDQRVTGDRVLAIGRRGDWLLLDACESEASAERWMMWNGSMLNLGTLLRIDVQPCDALRVRVGKSGCHAHHTPGKRDEKSLLRTFESTWMLVIIAECGGYGKLWLDMPPQRACAASTMVGWVDLVNECHRPIDSLVPAEAARLEGQPQATRTPPC